jgi:hypothetical protein
LLEGVHGEKETRPLVIVGEWTRYVIAAGIEEAYACRKAKHA